MRPQEIMEQRLIDALEDVRRDLAKIMEDLADMYDYYEKNGEFLDQNILELRAIRDYVRAGGIK